MLARTLIRQKIRAVLDAAQDAGNIASDVASISETERRTLTADRVRIIVSTPREESESINRDNPGAAGMYWRNLTIHVDVVDRTEDRADAVALAVENAIESVRWTDDVLKKIIEFNLVATDTETITDSTPAVWIVTMTYMARYAVSASDPTTIVT